MNHMFCQRLQSSIWSIISRINKWVCLTCTTLHMLKCNIAYVKVTKNSKFLLKINNYLLKSYVFNTKYISSNAKLLFKTS